MKNQTSSYKTKKLVTVAMFAALAYGVAAVCSLTLPKVAGFLSLDVKDALIVICALIFGPVATVPIAIIVPLLEFIIPITGTGVYGLIMNILSSLTFCVVVGVIYKYKRTFYGAIIALVAGIFSVTVVMMLANIIITPLFMKVPRQVVIGMLPTVLLPFNFTKATLNGAVVLLLYKPMSNVLKKTRMIEYRLSDNAEKRGFDVRSLVVTVISVAVIVSALCIVFIVLK